MLSLAHQWLPKVQEHRLNGSSSRMAVGKVGLQNVDNLGTPGFKPQNFDNTPDQIAMVFGPNNEAYKTM